MIGRNLLASGVASSLRIVYTTRLAMGNGTSSIHSLLLVLANMARLYSKHGAISGSNINTSTSDANSYLPNILSRLDALESAIRNTTSPISPLSTNTSNPSPSIPQNTIPSALNAGMSLSLTHLLTLTNKSPYSITETSCQTDRFEGLQVSWRSRNNRLGRENYHFSGNGRVVDT